MPSLYVKLVYISKPQVYIVFKVTLIANWSFIEFLWRWESKLNSLRIWWFQGGVKILVIIIIKLGRLNLGKQNWLIIVNFVTSIALCRELVVYCWVVVVAPW
jgi:hypothetical protein